MKVLIKATRNPSPKHGIKCGSEMFYSVLEQPWVYVKEQATPLSVETAKELMEIMEKQEEFKVKHRNYPKSLRTTFTLVNNDC